MAGAVGAMDEAIREYLLFRGFLQTLKVFEQEKKDDREKGFRVSRAEADGEPSITSVKPYEILGLHKLC